MTYKKLPLGVEFLDLLQLYYRAKRTERVGQWICNLYLGPRETWPELFYAEDVGQAQHAYYTTEPKIHYG